MEETIVFGGRRREGGREGSFSNFVDQSIANDCQNCALRLK